METDVDRGRETRGMEERQRNRSEVHGSELDEKQGRSNGEWNYE